MNRPDHCKDFGLNRDQCEECSQTCFLETVHDGSRQNEPKNTITFLGCIRCKNDSVFVDQECVSLESEKRVFYKYLPFILLAIAVLLVCLVGVLIIRFLGCCCCRRDTEPASQTKDPFKFRESPIN